MKLNRIKMPISTYQMGLVLVQILNNQWQVSIGTSLLGFVFIIKRYFRTFSLERETESHT